MVTQESVGTTMRPPTGGGDATAPAATPDASRGRDPWQFHPKGSVTSNAPPGTDSRPGGENGTPSFCGGLARSAIE
jgi:hypothetical protein